MTVTTDPVALTIPRVRTAIGISNQAIQAPYLDWANAQVITVGASATASVAYAGSAQGGATDTIWEVSSTTNCWYSVGKNNTAATHTAGSQYLAAGATRYIYIPGGSTLSVIEDSAGGYLSMVPALLA